MIAPAHSTKWRTVTLGDVAAPVQNAIVDGPFGSNLKLDDYIAEGVPVLQGKNITEDTFRWFDVRFISSKKAEELKRSSVRVGDILIVKIGSIGYSAILDDLNGFDHAIIPANLAKVTPNLSIVDLRYLHRWLTSTAAKHYLVRVSSKTAQPALSLGKIKGLPVPLPPLPEQRRIAEILDKADALRARRRAALAHLDTLTRSTFLDMFGDPATNPKGWPVRSIRDLLESASYGDMVDQVSSWTPNRDDPDGEFMYVDVGAVDQNSKTIASPRRLACADAPSRARQVIRSGDILVSTVRPNLNAVARVPVELDGATASTGFCVLRPRAEVAESGYLFHWVRSRRFVCEMVRRATGASYPAVSNRIVFESKIPLPPLPEQQRFAEVLKKVDALHATRASALRLLDTLIASLQHRAFRGEL